MSLDQIYNRVLLFSNPVWSGANTVPSTIIRNITTFNDTLGYVDTLRTNLTTLTRTNLQTRNGIIRGLLYVPEISEANPCFEQQYDLIPRNVTTREQLPPPMYNLIALAPWFNSTCTKAYLAAARLDPIRAFIFYRPNNSTREPQGVNSPIWDLEDGGAWHSQNHFPVFAVPGSEGSKMMKQLSLYSGDPSTIPFAEEVQAEHDPNPRDYIRVWTELTITDQQNLPAMWTWILIVVGALLFIIACVSVTMHLVQRQRRASLRRRVISREVDLEAMGIKRMAVPPAHIREFPLFTYSYQPEVASAPSTPLATRSLRSPRSVRTDQRAISDVMSSSRTRRSSLTSSANTIATNYQPQCHICLEQYEDRVSVIRELPCGHIFHPECIDEFLAINSSLCPICKKNMLPRGYCPKISNAMVRRERAIRRLRSRVVLDDSDDEGGEEKHGRWGKWLRRRDQHQPLPGGAGVPLTPVSPSKSDVALRPPSSPADAAQQPPSTQRTLETTQEEPAEDSVDPQGDGQAHHSTLQTPQPAAAAHHSSRKAKRRKKPRDLRLQAPQPGEQPLEPRQVEGRKSPSALARQRMRTLAGTPLDDPDGRRPVWRKAFTKVFPGFT
ncbi:hypothetical protein VD0004_g9690 [Verticillium dahliae]|nr:hypothetical protein VD0004_g9690 [Verticillium dahliae]PNH61568.1 hypothetical protein VD0001_g9669 [Verticillium dahliae]